MRELLIEAANGTNNPSDLKTMSLEVEQLTDPRSSRREHAVRRPVRVLGHADDDTRPTNRAQTTNTTATPKRSSRAVGPAATVVVSTNISTLLGNGKEAGDGGLLDTLRTITEHMQGGTAKPTRKRSAPATSTRSTRTSKRSRSCRPRTAARPISCRPRLSRNEGLQLSINESLSSTDGTNIAEASIAFANEQAAYTAALRAGANIVQESLLNFLQ